MKTKQRIARLRKVAVDWLALYEARSVVPLFARAWGCDPLPYTLNSRGERVPLPRLALPMADSERRRVLAEAHRDARRAMR